MWLGLGYDSKFNLKKSVKTISNTYVLKVPEDSGSQISRQSGHEDDEVVCPTQSPPLPPFSKKYSWYSSLLEAESTPGLQCGRKEGVCQLKITVTSSRIEPATFRLVAQCLNEMRHLYICNTYVYFNFFFPVLNCSYSIL